MASRPRPVSDNNRPEDQRGWTRRTISRDEKLVRLGMAAHEDSRKNAIQSLKTAVWSGTYDPEVESVAEAMLTEREANWRRSLSEEQQNL